MWNSKFNFLGFLLLLNTIRVRSDEKTQQILDGMFNDYDKGIRPNLKGPPVKVGITIYVLQMTEFNDKDMTFTLSLYFRQTWNDPRLHFQGSQPVQIEGDRIDNLWRPDTFIANEITSFQHQTFKLNQFIRVSPNGDILLSGRYTVTASCPMDFAYFPFDSQICNLEIESFGFSTSDVQYLWANGMTSVGVSKDASNPSFRLVGYMLKSDMAALSSGNYSRLSVEFKFVRSIGGYILRIFLPLIFFTLVSLLSVWVISERLGSLVNFINICCANLFMAEIGSKLLPIVSYTTAIDTYVTICSVHIFLCLLDCLIGAYFEQPNGRTIQSIELRERRHPAGPVPDDIENLVTSPHSKPISFTEKFGRIFRFINAMIKIALLVSFCLCNFIYFIFFNSNSNPHNSDDVSSNYIRNT